MPQPVPQRQQITLIFWAIFVAPVIVTLALVGVQSTSGSPLSGQGRLLAFVAVGVALGAAAAAPTVFKAMLGQFARRFRDGPPAQIALGPTVVALAVCEAAGMISAVLFFLGGDVVALVGAGLALVGMWPLRPTPERWDEIERLVDEARRRQ